MTNSHLNITDYRVMRSNAGWYVGRACFPYSDLPDVALPYDRQSGILRVSIRGSGMAGTFRVAERPLQQGGAVMRYRFNLLSGFFIVAAAFHFVVAFIGDRRQSSSAHRVRRRVPRSNRSWLDGLVVRSHSERNGKGTQSRTASETARGF